MINTTDTYKSLVLQNSRQWKVQALITLYSGNVLGFTNTEIMQEGVSIKDGTSNQNEFSVGAAVSREITLKIKNYDGVYTKSEFDGSVIHLKVGLITETDETEGDTVEWLDLGLFSTSDVASNEGVITLTAYDNMACFSSKYDSALKYPATLLEILQDACDNCGVPLATTKFLNNNYTVQSRPTDSAITYRDIVSYVAQLAGCFARCDNSGALVLSWYDMDRFYQDSGDVVDGGNFSDYSQTDVLDGGPLAPIADAYDGGTFLEYQQINSIDGGEFGDYSEEDSVDGGDFDSYGTFPSDIVSGGVFRQGLQIPVQLTVLNTCSIAESDIRVTGVQIVPDDDKKPTYFRGAKGYVISIEKNPLAQDNTDQLVANLAAKLVDFAFRPMTITSLSDPSIEAGDVAYLTDAKGNQYITIISNIDYTEGDWETFTADAESESERQEERYSASAKAVATLKAGTKAAIGETNTRVDTLHADTVAQINVLQANKVDTTYLEANYITADSIKSAYATIDNLNAANANIQSLQTTKVDTDYLTANYVTADNLQTTYATIENLNATNARIDNITAGTVTTEYLEANYAKIDLANIAAGTIKTAMIDTGAVGTAQIADGSITDAKIVNLTADKITAGTLSVERLIITGSDQSIVYTINEANGTAQLSQTTIDGGSLTQRSITADRIVAGAITADEIAAHTITANELAVGTITAESGIIQSIDAGTITTGKIISQNGNSWINLIDGTFTLKGGSFSGDIVFSDTCQIVAVGGVQHFYGRQFAFSYYPGTAGSSACVWINADDSELSVTNGGNDKAITANGNVEINGTLILQDESYDDGSTTKHWHKYPDGTLHQWGYITVAMTISVAFGSVYRFHNYSVSLPATLIGNSVCTVNIYVTGANAWAAGVNVQGGNSIHYDVFSPTSFSNAHTEHYYDIWGRWK